MPGDISIRLDFDPPSSGTFFIDGTNEVDTSYVIANLFTRDFVAGQQDVTHMTISGAGLHTTANAWYDRIVPYQQRFPMYLTSGAGEKVVEAVLHDRWGNETDLMTLTLNKTESSVNRVHILNRLHATYNPERLVYLWWMAEQNFDDYQLCLCPSTKSSYEQSFPLPSSIGTNITATASTSADQVIETSYSVADLASHASSTPGFLPLLSGGHVFKMFVRSTGGEWHS